MQSFAVDEIVEKMVFMNEIRFITMAVEALRIKEQLCNFAPLDANVSKNFGHSNINVDPNFLLVNYIFYFLNVLNRQKDTF